MQNKEKVLNKLKDGGVLDSKNYKDSEEKQNFEKLTERLDHSVPDPKDQ